MQQQVVVGGCNDQLSELGSATMASLASLGGCENWLDELGSTTTASLAGLTASMESHVQARVDSVEEDTPELRTQVYVEATGSETRKRVRGYGHGVTPEMVSYASSSTARSSRKSSTGALAKREEKAAKQLAEVQAQLQQSQTLQQQINQQHQQMNQQMMMQQQKLLMMLMIHLQYQPPPSLYPIHQMPLQQPMSYMQQPPFQMPVYRP
ncbi:hypothetical protein D8674_026436 [Pyrus ussuriensis x Pyrus communis]|uniref:Uncharacterized protein n=1 Tax=Pyrus ussuriensis x Pyrus communis TaxID=2448454 RepID=A0A5N5IBL3_9ROSA|nr:hypothetical protein D8674_026436 [Pyrus ussuriensis x Pyrus communis]